MTAAINERERTTQDHIVAFFQNTLGYQYLGNRQYREDNTNIEEETLRDWLKKQGYSDTLISQAIRTLTTAAADLQHDLYDVNKKVYQLLRYPIQAMDDDRSYRDVRLIDWDHPENNDIAIAEEVTIHGISTNRPDIVIYLNGIAVAVLELKRSSVHLTEGIRQNIGNQGPEYIRRFFTTNQLLLAGNETEGVRYGVIETPERYYLKWTEEAEASDPLSQKIRELRSNTSSLLEQDLISLCHKQRLLTIIRNFILFDDGIKKTCRHNQFFAVTAAPASIQKHGGGIIWHTQGSGKSITMIWLAALLAERDPAARILIVTDRTELDKQIARNFVNAGENTIVRAKNGTDLIINLKDNTKRIICSLIHKFGKQNDTYAEYLKELQTLGYNHLPGKFYVFIDECHRTQSGELHAAMKRLLPSAVIIGFTGTPLLKKDIKSVDIFGGYIHKYTYDQGVRDHVILDLVYEARTVEQHIPNNEKIDDWFECKTKELTPEGKYILKKRWGTLQKLYSSKERLNKIVGDILLDMEKIPRLSSGQGNAMLVAGSIYEACKYYMLFQDSELAGKCALLSSYDPNTVNLKLEQNGQRKTEEEFKAETHKRMWGTETPEQFETRIVNQFKDQPGKMKLLIVVDRFLTGFDAPHATYLYIDKHMQDHGLFQAICRVNRLDTDDKEHGYIIDYKNLFQCLNDSIRDYTTGAFENYLKSDIEDLLISKMQKANDVLKERLQQLDELCEPLYPSKELDAFLNYFCNAEPDDMGTFEENKIKRDTLYKLTGSLARAYADIKGAFPELGYSKEEETETRRKVEWYISLRREISIASGDAPDLRVYDPAMRDLIDRFISAKDSTILAKFEDRPLLELIDSVDDITELFEGKKPSESVAETVSRNIARHITEKRVLNPKYYDRMSAILSNLILEHKKQIISYAEYLQRLKDLTRSVLHPELDATYPKSIRTSTCRQAIYEYLDKDEKLTLAIEKKILEARQDGWRGHSIKENKIKRSINELLNDRERTLELFEIIKQHHEY